MTILGLLLEACHLARVQEPLAFFDLSPMAQELWLSHAKNRVENAYAAKPTKGRSRGKAADPGWTQAAIAAARARGALPGGDR